MISLICCDLVNGSMEYNKKTEITKIQDQC